MPMKVLVLGAGFGGLELATTLSEEAPGEVEVTLIDKGDAFVFGYSKLDVMFGRTTADAVRLPYARRSRSPGVRFCRRRSPRSTRTRARVTTERGTHEADVLVVALGADYDYAATPGPDAGRESSTRSRRRAAAPSGSPAFERGPRDRRRLRRAVQVPARAERVRPAAARPPDRARAPRPVRDHLRHPVPDADPAVAGHERGAHRRRSRSAGSSSSPRRASPRSTTARSSPATAASSSTTSSSACRSTARPTSSSRAG